MQGKKYLAFSFPLFWGISFFIESAPCKNIDYDLSHIKMRQVIERIKSTWKSVATKWLHYCRCNDSNDDKNIWNKYEENQPPPQTLVINWDREFLLWMSTRFCSLKAPEAMLKQVSLTSLVWVVETQWRGRSVCWYFSGIKRQSASMCDVCS